MDTKSWTIITCGGYADRVIENKGAKAIVRSLELWTLDKCEPIATLYDEEGNVLAEYRISDPSNKEVFEIKLPPKSYLDINCFFDSTSKRGCAYKFKETK